MDMQLLEELLCAYGPSGREDAVRDVLSRALAGHADSIETDTMGNLIAVRRFPGPGRRVMLCAHMDQIGLAAVDADKRGFLRVAPVGGVEAKNMIAAHVVFENGAEGVVDCLPGKNAIAVEDLYVDIGASSREEALSAVAIGDVCVVKPRLTRLGEHRLAAPAMDDRLACYALVEVMRALPEKEGGEVAAVFTVQEEVGVRGATAAAYALNPSLGVALDVTMTGDTPKAERLPMRLGEGAAIKVMDAGAVSTPWVVRLMEDKAKERGIKVQREVLPYGGTDACAIQSTRAGVPAGAISIPCRYVHSAAETVDLRDVQAVIDLALAVAED